MKKKLLIIIGLIVVCGIIGYPKFVEYSQSKISNNFYSHTESFPWDLTLWEDAKLKCQNSGKKSSEIMVSLLGKKDSESVATSFNIRAKKSITKKISKLASLRKKQNSQSGVILVESENNNISCKILDLPFKGSSTIDSGDVVAGKSYIASTPNVLKDINDKANGKIIIYNLENSPLNLEIQSYTQTGVADYYKQLKKIGSGRKRVLKLKNITKNNVTFHIIPKEEYSRYYAYLEITDQNGKKYLIKKSKEIEESLIKDARGTLVVSNISSSPTSFTYTISSEGRKEFQGNEWLMPYSQRIFNLSNYTKKLSSPKMRIEGFNLFKDEECSFNEEKNEYECFYNTKKGLILLTFYPKNTKSPKLIKNINDDNELEGIPAYDVKDYLTKEIPVKCYKNKDTDHDGLCDFEEEAYGSSPYEKDSDNDGLEDGKEIFHNFSSPNMIDSDKDDYDDYTEYEARTMAFSSDMYPGSPSLYSLEGDYQFASDYNTENLNEVETNGNYEIKMSRSELTDWLNVAGRPVFGSCTRGHNPTSFCKGEKICIDNAAGIDDTKLNQVKEYIESCLAQIRGAIVNTKGESGDCSYCKTDFECSSDSTLTYIIDPYCNRSYTYPHLAKIHLCWYERLGNERHFTTCHELLHNFGLADLYNQYVRTQVCSMMQASNICMSSYDKLFMQKIRAGCYGNPMPESCEIIIDPKKETKIAGVHFVSNGYSGPCEPLPEDRYGNCKQEPCGEDPDRGCQCPIDPMSYLVASTHPTTSSHLGYACCTDPNAEYCENLNVSSTSDNNANTSNNNGKIKVNVNCCSGSCIDDKCCDKPIKVGDKKVCCNESEDKSEWTSKYPELTSSIIDSVCGKKCPDSSSKPNAKFVIAKGLDKEGKLIGKPICCQDRNAGICAGACCSGPCLPKEDKQGDGITEECCDGANELNCGGKCCVANKCLKNDDGLQCCDEGVICDDKCCDNDQICNDIYTTDINEIEKYKKEKTETEKNKTGTDVECKDKQCQRRKCNGKDCQFDSFQTYECTGDTCQLNQDQKLKQNLSVSTDKYYLLKSECIKNPCEDGALPYYKNYNELACCDGAFVAFNDDRYSDGSNIQFGFCCTKKQYVFYNTADNNKIDCCEKSRLKPNGKKLRGISYGECCEAGTTSVYNKTTGEYECQKDKVTCQPGQTKYYDKSKFTEKDPEASAACCPPKDQEVGVVCGSMKFSAQTVGECCKKGYHCGSEKCERNLVFPTPTPIPPTITSEEPEDIPSGTPSNSETSSPSNENSNTSTPSNTASSHPSVVPSRSPSPSASPSSSVSSSATPKPTPCNEPIGEYSDSSTPSNTASATVSGTPEETDDYSDSFDSDASAYPTDAM